MKLAISVGRDNLVSLGTCFGKFSKSGKFKLHITALDHVAQYAKYKVSDVTAKVFYILIEITM
jgi:ribosome biogenesis protein Nip4